MKDGILKKISGAWECAIGEQTAKIFQYCPEGFDLWKTKLFAYWPDAEDPTEPPKKVDPMTIEDDTPNVAAEGKNKKKKGDAKDLKDEPKWLQYQVQLINNPNFTKISEER